MKRFILHYSGALVLLIPRIGALCIRGIQPRLWLDDDHVFKVIMAHPGCSEACDAENQDQNEGSAEFGMSIHLPPQMTAVPLIFWRGSR